MLKTTQKNKGSEIRHIFFKFETIEIDNNTIRSQNSYFLIRLMLENVDIR